MPATVIVTAGPEEGTTFEVCEDVLRIGSGPQCEFRILAPDLADHAATLEYREDGQYHLHNRSTDPMEIGGEAIGFREVAVWPPGEEVVFGHGVILRLDVEGDPAPDKSAKQTYTYEYDAEEPEVEGEGKAAKPDGGAKRMVNLMIIIAAVPLLAFMLTIDPAEEEKTTAKPVRFEELLGKLNQNKQDQARGQFSVRNALQRARAAELRGDKDEARRSYEFIRDTLQLHRLPDGKYRDPADQEVWDYVRPRLQALQRNNETP